MLDRPTHHSSTTLALIPRGAHPLTNMVRQAQRPMACLAWRTKPIAPHACQTPGQLSRGGLQKFH
ncbi:MAG: hypothetical protein DWH85_02100 [Planctomycetota bacterium]|nr:MAG: hypothetical protein DWH85_02100 [Planctomycetota bacterium]